MTVRSLHRARLLRLTGFRAVNEQPSTAEWPKNVERHWFVVARSDAVRAKPQRVTLFGRRWAVARSEDGAVMAVEDRCPHRHAPLSEGHLTAEGLRCPYHGWTFSRSGSRVHIPGWPAGQPSPDVRVPTLAIVERDGLVWGAAQPVTDAALPRAIVALDPSCRRFLWQTRWGAPILEALENFLDALHTHLIHPGLVSSLRRSPPGRCRRSDSSRSRSGRSRFLRWRSCSIAWRARRHCAQRSVWAGSSPRVISSSG